MTQPKSQYPAQQLHEERKRLAYCCYDPRLLEVYLRPFEDALRVRTPGSGSEVGVVETGFAHQPFQAIPRSHLLAALRQAFANASIFYPKGLGGGLYGSPDAGLYGTPESKKASRPSLEELVRISESPLNLLIQPSLTDALEGGKVAEFFEHLARISKDLLKEDQENTMVFYVTAVHKATLELVREVYERYKRTGSPKPWQVLGIPTFMPRKYDVKKKAVALFGTRVPGIDRKKNADGTYRSRDRVWTRIFKSAGLRALTEGRGKPRRRSMEANDS
jgi:hypothetical protein